MVDGIIIEILKSGATAIIGVQVVKAVGQVEIAKYISMSGWAIVGIDVVKLTLPIIKGIQSAFDKVEGLFDKADNITENISKMNILGEFIKRGIVHSTNGGTGGW